MRYINLLKTTGILGAAAIAACRPSARVASSDTAASKEPSKCSADSANAGHYASVNGLKMYYETHGSGDPPFVLLHGALMTIQTSFGRIIPVLACSRRVIGVEEQAHGRTADIDRPLTYEQMADDVAELLRQLGVRQADFIGYSMGAAQTVVIANRHPEVVRRMVIVSGGFSNEMYQPAALQFMRNIDTTQIAWSKQFEDEFRKVAPQPNKFVRTVGRVKELVASWRGVPRDAVRRIQAPTLIFVGDRDGITLEHAIELYRLLPKAQLAVLPATDHFPGMVNRAEWELAMIQPFLAAPDSAFAQ